MFMSFRFFNLHFMSCHAINACHIILISIRLMAHHFISCHIISFHSLNHSCYFLFMSCQFMSFSLHFNFISFHSLIHSCHFIFICFHLIYISCSCHSFIDFIAFQTIFILNSLHGIPFNFTLISFH